MEGKTLNNFDLLMEGKTYLNNKSLADYSWLQLIVVDYNLYWQLKIVLWCLHILIMNFYFMK